MPSTFACFSSSAIVRVRRKLIPPKHSVPERLEFGLHTRFGVVVRHCYRITYRCVTRAFRHTFPHCRQAGEACDNNCKAGSFRKELNSARPRQGSYCRIVPLPGVGVRGPPLAGNSLRLQPGTKHSRGSAK